MNSKQIEEITHNVLKNDDRIWIDEEKTILDRNKLIDLLEKTDSELMTTLLQNEKIKQHFFVNVNDVLVFKMQDFRFFLDKHSVANSYTKYVNRIGLTTGSRFLKDSTDVVLDFPYKDCVLNGGQSTEEGIDIYFERNKNAQHSTAQHSTAQLYTKTASKRKEIFFNQILAYDEIDRLFDPKALTKFTRYNSNDSQSVQEIKRHPNGTIAENLIIKGNNLIALHTLKKQFKEKIKLIYIDVPFNTGNDSFAYNDKFNRSTWLTFMKNRLEAAKELLSDDGVFLVHCDYNEDAYLKILLDEIFTEDNFVANIAVRSSTPSGTKTAHKDKKLIKQKDTILFYKNKNIELKPQYTAREKWDSHYSQFLVKENGEYKFLKLIDVLKENGFNYSNLDEIDPRSERLRRFIIENKENIGCLQSHKNKDIDYISRTKYKDAIYEHFKDNNSSDLYFNGRVFTPISKGINNIIVGKSLKEYWSILVCDFWEDIDFQNTQNEGGISFPTGKKPEALLHRIIDMTTKEGDIVLDYHLGSGTTAAVAHKMNRQYIGIEQMDYIEALAVERLKNVISGEQSGISKAVNWQGGGEFIYFELATLNEQAKNKILDCQNITELTDLFSELCEKYFLKYNVNVKKFSEVILNEKEFLSLDLNKQKQMVLEMLDLNQMYISASEMEDIQFTDALSKEDITLTKAFYGEK